MNLITVITVTYNCCNTLQKTLDSIIAQDLKNIEHIIIDGGSTDGTLELIRQHEEKISRWVSEPDKGIYDAMDKGLRMATGDFVWFMNAGDEIYHPHTLSQLFSIQRSHDVDIFYGDAMIVDALGKEIGLRRLKPPENLTWKSLKKGMLVCHQSFIARRQIAASYQIERYRFSADYDWELRTLKNAHPDRIFNTGLVLSKFLEGGRSQKTIIPSIKERFHIMTVHYGLLSTIIYHIPIPFRFLYFWIRHKRF